MTARAAWWLYFAAATPAVTQQPLVSVPIDSGTVVRLHFRNGPPVEGRLTATFTPDSTGFRYAIGTRISEYRTRFPRNRFTPAANVVAVDVQAGSHSQSGALVGGAVGVGFGVLGYRLFRSHCGNCATGLGFGVISLGGLSALLGSQLGGRSYIWKPAVELPPPFPPAASLDSGTIVRLELAGGARVSGTLLVPFRPDSTAFVYCAYPARRACRSRDDRYAAQTPAARVRDVRVRVRSRAPEGALLGGLVGMFGGITACEAFGENSSCNGPPLLFISGAFGAFIGVMAGSSTGVWRAPR